MHKFTKFLLVLLLILLVLYVWLSNFNKDYFSMANKVGMRVGGGELTVSDYYTLVQCMETYKGYIAKKEYDTAYNMLGASYRNFLPYDEYEKQILDVDVEKMIVKDINIITQTTFDMIVGESGEETHYSIIIDKNSNTFALYPDSFLEYRKVEIEESQKSLKCTLVDYVVNTDKTVMNLNVKNKSNEEIVITKSVLHNNLDQTITNSNTIKILPDEDKVISIEFATDYSFPEKLVLERSIAGKESIEYSFEIN